MKIRRQESGPQSGRWNSRKRLLQPLNHILKVIDGIQQNAPRFFELRTASSVRVKGVADFPNDELRESIARTRSGCSVFWIEILREVAILIGFVSDLQQFNEGGVSIVP